MLKSSVRAQKLGFFKVFIHNHSARRMKIPPGYRKHMKDKNSGPLYLLGPCGNYWRVKLIKENDELYFAKGWPTFLKDHAIREGHFLVFEFDGDDTYKVKIYNPSGCENEAAFSAKPSRCCARNPNEPVKDLVVKVKTEEGSDLTGEEKLMLPACSAATYPSFVVQIKAYSVQEPSRGLTLCVPSDFAKVHMTHFTGVGTPICLRCEGKEWPANVSCTNQRTYICGGWRDFVRGSKLKKGDSCKFELLDPYVLRVHISKPVKKE